MLRVYLVLGAREPGKPFEVAYGHPLKVHVDPLSGEEFVEIHSITPLDPSVRVHEGFAPFIKRVTYEGTIYCGFRPDGIYRHGCAVLMASRYQGTHQDISASAWNFKALVGIYTLFRQWKIDPEENWEGGRSKAAWLKMAMVGLARHLMGRLRRLSVFARRLGAKG